jgi:tryptophan synthase alpha chain
VTAPTRGASPATRAPRPKSSDSGLATGDSGLQSKGGGRIATTMARLRQSGSLALVGWQTVGYPQPGVARRLVPALLEGGFDLMELGVPFSDPQADGPTIQQASQVALEHGTTMIDCLRLVRDLRQDGVAAPLIFLSYYNTILAMGPARFAEQAASAGLDGLIDRKSVV